jgi:hypothetical protein
MVSIIIIVIVRLPYVFDLRERQCVVTSRKEGEGSSME